jgi:zinc protease
MRTDIPALPLSLTPVGADEVLLSAGPCFGLVTVRLVFRCGAVHVPAAHGRAAWDMLERGTAVRDRAAWFTALEDLGASVESRLSSTWAVLEVDALDNAIEAAVELLIEPLLSPLRDREELDDWRDETDEEIASELEEVDAAVERLFAQQLWSGQVWGEPRSGGRSDRARVRLVDLDEALATLAGSPAIVAISADEPEQYRDLATTLLARLRAAIPVRPLRTVAAGETVWGTGGYVVYPASEQGALSVVRPSLEVTDPRWPAAAAHAAVFGGGFASPLVRRLRGELGLSYEVSWSPTIAGGRGCWVGRVQPTSLSLAEALRECDTAWERFIARRLGADEVAAGIQHLVGQHLAALETAPARAAHGALLRCHGFEVSRAWELPRAVQALDVDALEAISAWAASHPERAWVAGVQRAEDAPLGGTAWTFPMGDGRGSRLA